MAERYPLPYAWAKQLNGLLEQGPTGRTLFVDAEQANDAVWCARLSETLRVYGPAQLQATETQRLKTMLVEAYEQQGSSDAAALMNEVENDVDLARLMQDLPQIDDLLDASNDAPIIRMLNALLMQAAREGASDIHIEPYERASTVRFRVDGHMRDVVQPNRGLHNALISRIKIMSSLDIAEKRLPQDGRIGLRLGSKVIDVRVSTLPCAHGERAVLRLLDKSNQKLTLPGVGLRGRNLQLLEQLIRQPHGLVLVTGPTGSGKTTTLYAALQTLDATQSNIMTVEDPVEYNLHGVAQTQVNAKIDLTFSNALRAILRQDPDVIMIGEIRDQETAQIAIQASLTGHLVLATLHTNDAASAVTRLTDMGVEPFLLSSSLLGVLAQRLVRKTCSHCHGAGCTACNATGYSGRTGVFELLHVDETIQRLIHDGANEVNIRYAAQQNGMQLMRQDGEELVRLGLTTAEEVLRATKD